MPRPATIKDVAAHAGVSPATVSNYLNGRYRSAPEIAESIDRAVRELSYRRNASASALRTEKTGAVALLNEDPDGFHDPMHTEYLEGILTAAKRHGMFVIVGSYSPDEIVSRAEEVVTERRADGLILTLRVLGRDRAATLGRIAASGTPMVLLQQRHSIPLVSTIYGADEEGTEAAVQHLLELGHRDLAYLTAKPLWPSTRRRLDAFRSAAARVPGAVPTVHYCADYTPESARVTTRGVLQRRPRPTAVICASDLVALGALQGANDRQLTVPGDLSVVGFNDLPLASWSVPALTTVRTPGAEMGERAAELVVRGRSVREHVSFDTPLVIRDSTSEPPRGNRLL